jgi:DNA primase
LARFPREVVDAVRDRTDIAEVVQRHVKLTRRGRNFVGLCPFHQEKTPSFNVIQDKGIFHCFGCQAGGDVFKFLQLIAGLSFGEAVRELATAAGVEIEERELTEAERAALRARATLYDVLEAATVFYENVLWTRPEGAVGRAYLAKRALGDETVKKARLGFAAPGWRNLHDALVRRFPDQLLLDAGLVRPGDRGNYDTFRDRLIFPIRDERGRTVGFGGRILEGDGPKYINTPETRLYQKSTVLYGIDMARAAIGQKDRVIVVEGYMDVLSLHQAGFSEAIATCGTALTAEHLERIRRLSRNVVLLLDGDEAGLRAAEKALPMFLSGGILPWRLELPDAKDPDELVREHGAGAMETALEQREPLLEWTLDRKLSAAGPGAQAREKVLEEVAPWLLAVDDPGVVARVARRMGSTEGAVAKRLADIRARNDTARPKNAEPPDTSGWRAHRDVVHLLWLLVHRYAQVADLLPHAPPELFVDHRPVIPVLARLSTGEPVAAVLDEIADPGVGRTLAAVVARAKLYEPEQAALAMAQLVARFYKPLRISLLGDLSRRIDEAGRHGDAAALRSAATRRATLVAEDRDLERALASGDARTVARLLGDLQKSTFGA